MKLKKLRMLLVSVIAAVGILMGSTPVMAETIDTGDHGYYDSWNNITAVSVEDTENETEASASSITKSDENANSDTGYSADISIVTSTDTKNVVSAEATGSQKTESTPDLNISFDVSGSETDGDGLLTPNGNLTLVDDLDADESSSLQYMTVQTKSGAYFYIVIDRSSDEENVYFLNTVDEADLMALMDDDTKAQFTDSAANEDSASVTGLLLDDSSKDKTVETEGEDGDTTASKSSTGNPVLMLLIFAVLGGGVAFGYYKLKIKPGKNQPKADEEDLEFYDDEEYEEEFCNEDSEEQTTEKGITDSENKAITEDDRESDTDMNTEE